MVDVISPDARTGADAGSARSISIPAGDVVRAGADGAARGNHGMPAILVIVVTIVAVAGRVGREGVHDLICGFVAGIAIVAVHVAAADARPAKTATGTACSAQRLK